MVRFISCEKTRETRERAERVFGDALPSVVINLGASNALVSEDEYRARGFEVINSCEGCGNCVNKLRMFGLLKRAGVSSLSYFDLSAVLGQACAVSALATGKWLVFRKFGEKPKEVGGLMNLNLIYKYDYATVFEDKVSEWRVLVYKGKAFRVLFKRGNSDSWCLKQENSRFILTPDARGVVSELAERAAVACGIDLCGIDLLLNKDNVFKVVEVNSGMGMGNGALRELKKLMEGEYRYG